MSWVVSRILSGDLDLVWWRWKEWYWSKTWRLDINKTIDVQQVQQPPKAKFAHVIYNPTLLPIPSVLLGNPRVAANRGLLGTARSTSLSTVPMWAHHHQPRNDPDVDSRMIFTAAEGDPKHDKWDWHTAWHIFTLVWLSWGECMHIWFYIHYIYIYIINYKL